MQPRLKVKYRKEIVPALQKEFAYKSSMQVPKLKKICINQGLGIAVTDKKLIDNSIQEISTITGQKAVATRSKKDISNFKLRKNMPIGVKVTLRGDKMYEFLDRLIAVSLPRDEGKATQAMQRLLKIKELLESGSALGVHPCKIDPDPYDPSRRIVRFERKAFEDAYKNPESEIHKLLFSKEVSGVGGGFGGRSSGGS